MLPRKLHCSQAEVIGFTMEATVWNVVAFGVPVVHCTHLWQNVRANDMQ